VESTAVDPVEQPSTVSMAAVLRGLAGLFWLFWGQRLYQNTFSVPGSDEAALAFTVGGAVVLGVAFLPLRCRWQRWFDGVLLALSCAAFVFWLAVVVYTSPSYGTDEVAFDQMAAQLVLQGHSPYGVDLSGALDRFGVPPIYTTNTMTGGVVRDLSYPALSFLFYVPLLAAGVQAQAAIYVDGFFWVASMVLLWLALPWRFRPVVPLLAGLTFYITFISGGVADSLLLPFMLGALWRWDRFDCPSETGLARWLGPVSLGLACAVKQTAWFLAPFLIVAIAVEARMRSPRWLAVVARYAGLATAAFLAPNLPFLLGDFPAWLGGAVLPILTPLVPFGQGMVAFSTYLHWGGGWLTIYSLAAGVLALSLCAALLVWYSRLKPLVPLLPVLVLLLPTRSLENYFLFAVPGLLVSVTTVGTTRTRWPWRTPRRPWQAVAWGGGAASLLLLALAVLIPAPLDLRLAGERTTGQLQSVDQLTVVAQNRTGAALQPHFTIGLGAYDSSYWLIHQGPEVLPAHATAQYVLWAPNMQSMPAVDQGFVVYAMTASPPAVSSTVLRQPTADHTRITPQAVNHLVGDSGLDLQVQAVNRLNQPVQQAGIPVQLGQALYAQDGVIPGETSINGHPEGQSPVEAMTDAVGIAHFAITAVQQQPYEVFFQAWLASPYPHGYSNVVSVNFRIGGQPQTP
jgi:uncharacterized membrane protein